MVLQLKAHACLCHSGKQCCLQGTLLQYFKAFGCYNWVGVGARDAATYPTKPSIVPVTKDLRAHDVNTDNI